MFPKVIDRLRAAIGSRPLMTLLALGLGGSFLASCGLETYTYLYPISTDGNALTMDKNLGYYSFQHNTQNNLDDFLGYEIFYKFYPEGSADILEDKQKLENTYIATQAPLDNLRFSRVRFKGESSVPPLLRLTNDQKSTPWVFKLDFFPLLSIPKKEPVFSWYQPDEVSKVKEFVLLRAARQVNREEESFVPNQILETDPDVIQMNVREIVRNRGKLAVVFVVIAYGIRVTDNAYLYSNAVFLNRSLDSREVLVIDLGH